MSIPAGRDEPRVANDERRREPATDGPAAARNNADTVPPPALVLVSIAGCSVFIGATVLFFTGREAMGALYEGTGADSTSQGLHTMRSSFRYRVANKARQRYEEDWCRSQLCRWNRDYIVRALDERKDPCDDFYAHACDATRWFRMGNASTRPFAELSTAQLMTDVERFFRFYVQLKGEPAGGPGENFLSRMMWVYGACAKETNVTRNVSEELAVVLEVLGINGEVPVRQVHRGGLASLVAAADRYLRLHPLFQVHVARPSGMRMTGGFEIVLSAPATLYRRFMTNLVESTDSLYADFVARTLDLYSPGKTRSAARKIVQLEKRLESFMLASEEELMMPPREKPTSLEDLFLADNWDWTAYFNEVIVSANGNIGNHTRVTVNDPIFFRNLGHVMRGTWDVVIANYIVFKTVVVLAPVLGEEAEFLLEFGHDDDVPDISVRKAACLVLLERLFKYGVGIVAKLTLGKEFATTPRNHMDRQLTHLFNASRHLITSLVESGNSWVNALDRKTASRKLQAMRFEFGAQSNLVDYELYRQALFQPNVTLTSSAQTLADGGDGNGFWDERRLPRIVFSLYVTASAAYWDAWGNAKVPAYDNRYRLTAFRAGYELLQVSNVLVVPQATVAFLNPLSNVLHPVLYGVVAADVVRGVLEVLTRSGSSVDEESRHRAWWSVGTIEAYENASACVESQHQTALVEGSSMRSLEMDFLDNAVAYPLFRLYRDAFGDAIVGRNVSGHPGVATTGGPTMDQMFFYNFAAAHCDSRDEELWKQQRRFHVTPAPWRVNVPLRNLPEFAEAFHCKPGTYMNPAHRCSVWKRNKPKWFTTDGDILTSQ
ncbi:endothelin-converting enzyme 1-like [Haemaphysalis longicornis]